MLSAKGKSSHSLFDPLTVLTANFTRDQDYGNSILKKHAKVMAEKGCESCSRWQEHFYREHMDVSRIRFFKILTEDCSHGISIPEKVAERLSGEITKGFNLKAPSGKTWCVGIEKVADELLLMSGWEDFAKAHELQENDLLFFSCKGNSNGICSFDVLIFDASGCEKLSCFFISKKYSYICKHFNNTDSQNAEQYLSSDCEDTNTPPYLLGSPHKDSTSKKLSGKTKTNPSTSTGKEPEDPNSSRCHVKHEMIEEEESDDDEHTDDEHDDYSYSRFASYLNSKERKQIFSLVSLQPGNPVFVTVLKTANIRRKSLLVVPSGFADEHLDSRSHEIVLIIPNKKEKWYVKYYHGNNTRGFICHRWFKFIRENRLQDGYICIFELMKGAKRVTMTVHVIGKVDNRNVCGALYDAGEVMADKGCESCSKWQEHYYREHTDGSRICFFRLMTGDFAHRVSIPEKFAKNFNGQIIKGFNLKAFSGGTWHVDVEKVADEMFLVSGWEDFAKAHELKENDLLFFTCNGKGSCSFDVLIFDASGCEKMPDFFTSKKYNYMCKHFNNISGQNVEHCLLSDSDDTSTPSYMAGSHKAATSKKVNGKTKISPSKEPENVKQEMIEEEESDGDDEHVDYYYSRFANYLTSEEREEIFSLTSLQPGNPVFVTVLRTGHVHRKNILIVPAGFAANHLDRKSHEIMLVRPNRKEKWYAKYYHANNTRGFSGYGWIKFICKNKLQEGYVCIFELMKGAKRPTMTVHVISKINNRFVLLG
uniref:TF-B3 domain-containing protein n=1 Tax=Leersia perrieri TaxID=77586 RepID=A0A0D9Y112_9ORYZ